MGYVTGEDRYQMSLFPMSLDEYVSEDNPCRVIDVFVDHLNLVNLGFKYAKVKDVGRPPYDPSDLLKLYIYGYNNKVRSSRRLQKETLRNVEVMWLLNGLTPDDKTISNFRTDNRVALKKVFRLFNQLCLTELNLFGKETESIDGSKFKANNSRRHRYTKKEAEDQLNRLEKQITEYLNDLDRNDSAEEKEPLLNRDSVEKALEKLNSRKVNYEAILKKIEDNDGNPVCTTDEDAALMKLSGGKGFEVSHNVQTAVDDKHGLVADFNVTNHVNDMLELSNMVERVQEALGVKELNILADTGYSNGKEINDAEKTGATCYIPKSEPNNQPKDEAYNRNKFEYDVENDQYICPAGNVLPYVRTRERDNFKVYGNRAACNGCPVKDKCTKSKTLREIERSPYQKDVDRAAQRVEENPTLYRRRQELSEHPFGVVKRIWGYDQFLCRGNEKVTGEISLMFLTFNMRRAISILGTKKVIEGIRKWAFFYEKTLVYLFKYVFIVRRTLKTHFVAAC